MGDWPIVGRSTAVEYYLILFANFANVLKLVGGHVEQRMKMISSKNQFARMELNLKQSRRSETPKNATSRPRVRKHSPDAPRRVLCTAWAIGGMRVHGGTLLANQLLSADQVGGTVKRLHRSTPSVAEDRDIGKRRSKL